MHPISKSEHLKFDTSLSIDPPQSLLRVLRRLHPETHCGYLEKLDVGINGGALRNPWKRRCQNSWTRCGDPWKYAVEILGNSLWVVMMGLREKNCENLLEGAKNYISLVLLWSSVGNFLGAGRSEAVRRRKFMHIGCKDNDRETKLCFRFCLYWWCETDTYLKRV